MKITQAIKMAFASICSTKLRSFLTMLGIIIGVMSVTVLVSIVQSTTNNVSDTLSQLGGNVISATVTSRRSNKITTSDLKTLKITRRSRVYHRSFQEALQQKHLEIHPV